MVGNVGCCVLCVIWCEGVMRCGGGEGLARSPWERGARNGNTVTRSVRFTAPCFHQPPPPLLPRFPTRLAPSSTPGRHRLPHGPHPQQAWREGWSAVAPLCLPLVGGGVRRVHVEGARLRVGWRGEEGECERGGAAALLVSIQTDKAHRTAEEVRRSKALLLSLLHFHPTASQLQDEAM